MLEKLKHSVGEWLRGGPEGDVVVSSRVRLARNIAGYRFLPKASAQEIARIEELLRNRILSCNIRPELTYYRVDELDPLLRELLVEKHLMGKDHAEAGWVRGIAFCPQENLSLMVNEEDHLRIQVIRGGFRLQEAWQEVNRIDDVLAECIPFAFSERYGYLTGCPTNVGTGMRASAMLHLPALVMSKEMDRVIELARRFQFALRGLYGEGTQASADFYQISNQVSLGLSEESILQNVSKAVSQLISLERACRESLFAHHRRQLKDRIGRALEMLVSATAISTEEALHLLSQVRLGVEMALVNQVRLETLNELLLLTLPAHLQTIEGRKADGLKRNELRASCVKGRLGLN